MAMVFNAPYTIIGGGLSTHLHPDHLADLRASGLTDETIRAAGVYSIAPRQIQHFFSMRKGVPSEIETALCFPYQGRTFARIKLFPALDKMKYSQPPGTSARLYMPFKVIDGPIWICEGEKKTLAAHQAGLNAVGIGGVWSWMTKGEPIDDLNSVTWQDREAVIIPDSDVWQRPDLLRAIYALGREVSDSGADVLIAMIPHGEKKIGLDDYLLAGGDIDDLETNRLQSRAFQSCRWWHGKWKLKAAMAA